MLPFLPLPMPTIWATLPALVVLGLLPLAWYWRLLLMLTVVPLLALLLGTEELLQIPSHAAASGIGLLVGYLLWQRLAARRGIDERSLLLTALVGAAGGLLGARLWYLIEFWPALREVPWQTLLDPSRGGMVLYGAVIGGVTAGLLCAARLRLPRAALADAATPGALLAIACGRIGCFLNGCCYGGVCSLPWGLDLSHHWQLHLDDGQLRWQRLDSYLIHHQQHILPALGIDAPATPHLARHPTQIYEALFCGLAAAIAWRLAPSWQAQPGRLAGAGLVTYGLWRFLLEFLRADNPLYAFGLSGSQILSLLLILVGVGVLRRSSAWQAQPLPETPR